MHSAKLEVLKGPKNFGSLNGQSDPSASLAVGQLVVRHLGLQPLSISLSICLSIYLPIYLSIYLSTKIDLV